MTVIWAERALLPDGWAENVRVTVDRGRIAAVEKDTAPQGHRAGLLLPALANLHSHAFQRAMAGLSEAKGPEPRDTFWTWRQIMYRFLDHLTPEDVEAIAALVQMEMLEAGYATNVEFHYLHHRPGAGHYDNIAEMGERIAAAAGRTGIGLTLLPVHYQFGGVDRRPLAPGQNRFGTTPEEFQRLLEGCEAALRALPPDAGIGVAPHSLRAVSPEGLAACVALRPGRPLHMHLAEQVPEIEEISAAYGRRPVEWLLENHNPDRRWTLIHLTHMTEDETRRLAATGAVAGLCPITESSLGDGIFNGTIWAEADGRIGFGSDSNIRISLVEELRTLEYSQRLRDRGRAILAEPGRSTGRVIYEAGMDGGATAAGRETGAIRPGLWADLVAVGLDNPVMAGRKGDQMLDSLVFAGHDGLVRDTWSAGRHVVNDGRHMDRDRIIADYLATIARLQERM
ncbi:formimidoylglutamate deiminase [Paracoccus sp. P2]|uniref:Formimidoylglutamate deiminase n=1 Tax=Paracoccus pantotrophus TaxID=82367 RepID=A0A1I5JM64_PARPN|nr:formimidoylglutamate deiminase [Paracoccus pantotrophus]MDF3853467.1 formimidoylglutamate deiminase [Paracoccus pantotrophus]QFG38015.1 formimidoylglutamate deiminase [Paracoccus pantotrophus]QLH15571.1 formimidoylglutamate deiminase [Paracoccus pantotrophus]RDD96830.1 formimidoylglutamate deiminase [Paracoccus pantotrophus]RKS51497.1 formiminoglutamate deiminase [Paracoccus pantotrophus]